MPIINKLFPKSLSEYVDIIEGLRKKSDNHLWFRGIENDSFKLIPSLYRHKTAQTLENFSKLEIELMHRFQQRSLPYISQKLEKEWDTLFYMQHYSIPTRLLDWTENPLTALHFALISTTTDQIVMRIENKESAIVWVLDPKKWNTRALKEISYTGGPLDAEDPNVRGYKPNQDFSNLPRLPLAIFGVHNSPRIVAQQGVFTIFGKILSPMERIYTSFGFQENSLTKIIIKYDVIEMMRDSLLNIGITESVVFPDLVGLASEIKRCYGF